MFSTRAAFDDAVKIAIKAAAQIEQDNGWTFARSEAGFYQWHATVDELLQASLDEDAGSFSCAGWSGSIWSKQVLVSTHGQGCQGAHCVLGEYAVVGFLISMVC